MEISDYDTNFSIYDKPDPTRAVRRLNFSNNQKLIYNLAKIDWILDDGPYKCPSDCSANELSQVYLEITDLIIDSAELIEGDQDFQLSLVNFLNNGRLDKIITILVTESLFENFLKNYEGNDCQHVLVAAKKLITFIYEISAPYQLNLFIKCSRTLNLLENLYSCLNIHSPKDDWDIVKLFNDYYDYPRNKIDDDWVNTLLKTIFENCNPRLEIFQFLNDKYQLYTNSLDQFVIHICSLIKNFQRLNLICEDLQSNLIEYKIVLQSSILEILESQQISEVAYDSHFNDLIITFNEIFDEDIRFSQIEPSRTIIKYDSIGEYAQSNFRYHVKRSKMKPECIDIYYKTDSTPNYDIESDDKVKDLPDFEQSFKYKKVGFRSKFRELLGLPYKGTSNADKKNHWANPFRRQKVAES
ncbi:uncharacterized protein RJT21DRAFT_37456 [Scheffersomyces amazonensis]|uniref:uncharacterized protein n=1 Tax=Scheffersomyces amazonensis TaxID=1078765 RepID=UPI00315C8529